MNEFKPHEHPGAQPGARLMGAIGNLVNSWRDGELYAADALESIRCLLAIIDETPNQKPQTDPDRYAKIAPGFEPGEIDLSSCKCSKK